MALVRLGVPRRTTKPTLTDDACEVLDSALGRTGQNADFLNDRPASHDRRCERYSSRTEVNLDQLVVPTAASPNHVVGLATDPCEPNPTWHVLN